MHPWTLREMGSSGRRPHWASVLSGNWDYKSHELTKIEQQKIWKMFPYLTSLQHLDARIRIRHKQRESTATSCFLIMVQAAACFTTVYHFLIAASRMSLSSNHLKLVYWSWKQVHCIHKWPPQLSDLSPRSHHGQICSNGVMLSLNTWQASMHTDALRYAHALILKSSITV